MTLREATRDDIEGIREVARRSWETDYPGVVSRETAEEGVEEWYAPERLADELGRGRARVLVAEREGEVVGFAHAVWDDEEGHVLRLYVDPDHRREGVGSRLLERVRDDLFAQGVDRIRAMVLLENDVGNDFYRTFGFEASGRHETRVGDERHPENTYVLEREQVQEV